MEVMFVNARLVGDAVGSATMIGKPFSRAIEFRLIPPIELKVPPITNLPSDCMSTEMIPSSTTPASNDDKIVPSAFNTVTEDLGAAFTVWK